MSSAPLSGPWIRIDEGRNLRNPEPPRRGVMRIYGREGEDWPRLAVTVSTHEHSRNFPCEGMEDRTYCFDIHCSQKRGPGKWWQGVYVPVELASEVADMTAEFQSLLNEEEPTDA